MVGWLVKLATKKATRQIEEGSACGAAIGAVLGGSFGVGAAYLLHRLADYGSGWAGTGVTLGLAGALIGGVFGSKFQLDGPRTLGVSRASAVNDRAAVRISNLNHALGPIAAFVLLVLLHAAFGVMAISSPAKAQADLENLGLRLLLLPMFLLVTGVAAVRAVLWVDVGPQLRVRRLVGTRTYPLADVPDWGFAGSDGIPVRQPPPAGRATLTLLLPGRGTLRVPVDPATARRAAEIIAYHVR